MKASIRQTRLGHWQGFFGNHVAAHFGTREDSQRNAQEWLAVVEYAAEHVFETHLELSEVWAARQSTQQATVKLTLTVLNELEHKLWVLHDSEDLRASYLLTQREVKAIIDSLPDKAPAEWRIPAWAVNAVKGEMADCAFIVQGFAHNARQRGERAAALQEEILASRITKTFNK